jgi:adhesin transport system outer membrane protein
MNRHALLRPLLLLPLAALLAACGPTLPRSYVVLLPDRDGKVGQVVVTGPQGRQVLTQAGQVAALDGSAPAATPTPAQIEADFAAARDALPAAPEQHLLYFVLGSTQLTEPAEAALQQLIAQLRARPPQALATTEVVVSGHTDTMGSEADNLTLSMQRAALVASRLRATGLKFLSLRQEAHGEKNLLVPTKDETPEPRNRRVEVTVR